MPVLLLLQLQCVSVCVLYRELYTFGIPVYFYPKCGTEELTSALTRPSGWIKGRDKGWREKKGSNERKWKGSTIAKSSLRH